VEALKHRINLLKQPAMITHDLPSTIQCSFTRVTPYILSLSPFSVGAGGSEEKRGEKEGWRERRPEKA